MVALADKRKGGTIEQMLAKSDEEAVRLRHHPQDS